MKWDEDVSDMKYFVAFGNDIDFGWYVNDSIEFCKETDTVKPVTNKSERTHEDVIFDSIIWHLRNSVNNGKQNLSGGECEDYFREVVKKNNENKMSDCKKCGLGFGSVRCFGKDCPHNTPKSYAVGLKDGKVIECGVNKEIVRNENKSEFIIKHMILPNKMDDKLEYEIIDGYEFDKVENNKIILKPIKPKYPTTYEECCEVIGISRHDVEIDLPQPYQQKMFNLFKLRICRDAYWKIAGEQMGLAKTWEPDWEDETQVKYMITTFNNELEFFSSTHSYVVGRRNHILSLPSEEMRDAFYENFKDLIEQCKEML